VHELRVGFRLLAVANLSAPRLEALEVRDAGHFQPALLPGAPDLQVVLLGLCEAHVAGAHQEAPVRQTQHVEQPLGVGAELLQGAVAFVGARQPDEFDLVELVQAVEAAHVFAVGTGLAPEARRVGTPLDRQVAGRQDVAAEEVGDGHLGGRDGEERIAADFVHQVFLVRKLPGAARAVFVDEKRRLHLAVARLGGLVEEQLHERPLQARPPARVERKARAGDF
jgi:hypothetical protein